MKGLIGKKLGMTQVFDKEGHRTAVTVIEAGPCVVVQRKTKEMDGYDAIQLGFQEQKEHRLTKPVLGHFKRANSSPKRYLNEFKVEYGDEVKQGDTVTASIFEGVSFVDVTGKTKGRGFQGVVKRWRMRGGPMSHGGHSKRRVGSIGQCSFPARVVKGKRMPGHMGDRKVTQQNLKVVELQGEKNLLLVRGAIPGPNGTIVLVKKSLKKGIAGDSRG